MVVVAVQLVMEVVNMNKDKNNINKKLLALLIGVGLQIGTAEARPVNTDNYPTLSINSIKNITEATDHLINGCCGGGTCNGSC